MTLWNSGHQVVANSDSEVGELLKAAHMQEFTKDVARRTDHIYQRLQSFIPRIEWPVYAPHIAAINALKIRRNAVVLAHNYQTPDIFYGVADYVGDSLGLAEVAARTSADLIVLCGVYFMAETVKLLNFERTVLIPDPLAGCSLASSITADDVRVLREQYPGVPVVTYVNTSAAVKAESDICCTSANAVRIVESLGADRVILLPDEYLGKYVSRQTGVEVILWRGRCEVHERFTSAAIRTYRKQYEGIRVLAHPECAPDVLAESDIVGSTSQMITYCREERPNVVVMVTECSMSDNLALEFPAIKFIRPCNLCPHMKRITLPKVLRSLEELKHEVKVDHSIAARARQSLDRMMAVR